MSPVAYIVIAGIIIALIVFLIIFIIKNVSTPTKISSVDKLIKEGKLPQAEKIAKAVIQKDDKNYLAHYYLGKIYLEEGKTELAFMEYKIVNTNMIFNGDVSELDFRKQMASLYTKFNQNDEALKEYVLLTKLEPKNADYLYQVGKLYEAQNQGNMAMAFYNKALDVNKKHSPSLTAMGYLYYRLKQYPEAKQLIENSIKINSENCENYYYLGKILKETQDLSGACKAFDKAQRDPVYKQKALIEKGSCLLMADQIDQAINDLEIAVNASKDDASRETLFARYFLAASYEKVRKIDAAIEQWEKIFKVNRSFKDVATKLNEYKDLSTNDGMKEYLTCSSSIFVDLAKNICTNALKLSPQKSIPTKTGCVLFCTEEKNANGLNSRNQIIIVQFYRISGNLDEPIVRSLVDELKAQSYMKGIIITSSDFTPSAISYAENRSVVLYNKSGLEKLFNNIKL